MMISTIWQVPYCQFCQLLLNFGVPSEGASGAQEAAMLDGVLSGERQRIGG